MSAGRASYMLNTHTYDTYISSLGKAYIQEAVNVKVDNTLNAESMKGSAFDIGGACASHIDKDKLFENLKQTISNSNKISLLLKVSSIKAIELIQKNKETNFYGNSMNAEDLLYLIIKKFEDDNFLMIVEQLSDIITSGSCPAGRVNRLMQIVIGLYNL